MPVQVWATSEDGRFQWVTLSAKYLPATLEVFRTSFYVNETISKVVGMAASQKGGDQFAQMLAEIAEDGISIIAVETATDKVVGAALNKLQYKGDTAVPILERYNSPNYDPAFKELVNFMFQMEAKVDIFSLLGVDTLIDHMFLATHPDYYRQGIGLKTVAATVEFAKALSKGEDVVVPISENKFPWKKLPPPQPQAVIALFTSPLSQKIGQKLGWDEIGVTSYEELFYEGKSYASRLHKDNWCNKYMAIKISEK